MIHRCPAVLFAWLAALVPASFAANLSETYRDALENDPVLAAAEANFRANSEAVALARAGLLPQVQVSGNTQNVYREIPGSTQRPQEEFNQRGFNAQLRQPLLNMNAWYSLGSASATKRQAAAQFAAEEQQLIVRVATAYLDILRADAALEATRGDVAASRRQLEQVQQRFDVGLVAITDVLESQAGYDTSVVREIQAIGDREIFFESLRTLTNVAYDSIDTFTDELPIRPPEPNDPQEWVKVALASNLGVEAARQGLDAARRSKLAARANRLPSIDVVATRSHSFQGGLNFFGSRVNQRIYALEANLPIYQGGQIGASVRQTRAREDEAQYLLDAQVRVVDRDIRNLLVAVRTDVERVAARAKAIESAESALEATETGYQVGTRNIVDVQVAQQRLFSSYFDYADARYQYVLDLVLLKQTAGVLTPQDLYTLDQFTSSENAISPMGANAGS
jgi:outer membrane protein